MCFTYSRLRNLDQKPYSAEEAAVAEYLFQLIGIGGGDDPVGSLIVSHRELVRQRTVLRAKYPEIFDEIARDGLDHLRKGLSLPLRNPWERNPSSPPQPDPEETMASARKVMKRRRNALRELAE